MMRMQKSRTSINLLTSMSASVRNLNRNELEDKFFKLKDQHLELKKESNHAGNEMKLLNTKLARLINEKKKLMNKEKTCREIDLEELIYDLQSKMVQLEKENLHLRDKTLVLKTQLETALVKKKRPTSSIYAHVQSKTNTGLKQQHHQQQQQQQKRHTVNINNKDLIFEDKKPTRTDVGVSVSVGVSASAVTQPDSQNVSSLLEKIKDELELEKDKCLELKKKLLFCSVDQKSLEALQQQIKSLEIENRILKDSLEQCIGECLSDINIKSHSHTDTGRFESHIDTGRFESGQQNKRFRDRIHCLKKEVSRLKHELYHERIKFDKLNHQHHYLQVTYQELVEKFNCQNQLNHEKQNINNNNDTNSYCNRTDHIELKKQLQDTYCNRTDHIELKKQLEDMQVERHQLLNEFEEMKQMLQLIQNSIIDE